MSKSSLFTINNNIPYGQSSAKLLVTCYLVKWSLGHLVTQSLSHSTRSFSHSVTLSLGHWVTRSHGLQKIFSIPNTIFDRETKCYNLALIEKWFKAIWKKRLNPFITTPYLWSEISEWCRLVHHRHTVTASKYQHRGWGCLRKVSCTFTNQVSVSSYPLLWLKLFLSWASYKLQLRIVYDLRRIVKRCHHTFAMFHRARTRSMLAKLPLVGTFNKDRAPY